MHPAADVFVRAILADPAEVTTRLAFADWLEETGDPADFAWARYIRLMAEKACHAHGSHAYDNLDRRAAAFAHEIRASVAIDAAQLAAHAERLRQFLPGQRIAVKLAGYTVLPSLVALVSESVARENLVLPLVWRRRRLWLASTDPNDFHTLQKLTFILNRDVMPVPAPAQEILAAIDHHYARAETESVVSITYESPLVGLDGDPISRAIGGIFIGAFSQHEYGRSCDGFEIEHTGFGVSVVYLDRTRPVASEDAPGGVYYRLIDHLHSLPAESECVANGLRCRRIDIPLLSRRRFPATLERRADGGARWFRVRFRWADRE
jgi:uncharacterized protein (TIGR02996 family)